ncbi:MAG: hypothetical protein K0R83_1383, partial [Caulobacter sp.]|nr:hypothetical protein [Caulobacter sp.]
KHAYLRQRLEAKGIQLANKFQKGDVVVIKSGGPPMTIDKVPGDMISKWAPDVYEEYHCEWFKGATAQQGTFGEHLLEAYVPPKK